MATKKTTAKQIADATKPVIGVSPRRAPKAVLKVAAKKPSKVAAPAPTDKLEAAARKTQATAVDALPSHDVKNLKGLRAIMDQYPKATHYSTDIKFGTSIVYLHNLRGRKLAEVKLAK